MGNCLIKARDFVLCRDVEKEDEGYIYVPYCDNGEQARIGDYGGGGGQAAASGPPQPAMSPAQPQMPQPMAGEAAGGMGGVQVPAPQQLQMMPVMSIPAPQRQPPPPPQSKPVKALPVMGVPIPRPIMQPQQQQAPPVPPQPPAGSAPQQQPPTSSPLGMNRPTYNSRTSSSSYPTSYQPACDWLRNGTDGAGCFNMMDSRGSSSYSDSY